MADKAPEPSSRLEGTVKSVIYHSDESGYTVLRVERPAAFELARPEEVLLVGKTQAVWAGEDIAAVGSWVTDREYGRQFKADRISCIAPRSTLGIERYLASGVIKGVGAKTAQMSL